MLPQLLEERLGLSVLRKARATISNLTSRYRAAEAPVDHCGVPGSADNELSCEERAILCESVLCESGARPGVYGLLVKCCAMSLFERS
jgi:hypothetical protein